MQVIQAKRASEVLSVSLRPRVSSLIWTKPSLQPATRLVSQIIKRGDRAWQVTIFMGRDANRKQKFHRKTIYGTKHDAQRYLTAVRREMYLGVFVEPRRCPSTNILSAGCAMPLARASHLEPPTAISRFLIVTLFQSLGTNDWTGFNLWIFKKHTGRCKRGD